MVRDLWVDVSSSYNCFRFSNSLMTEEERLNNRISLPHILELLCGMCFLLSKSWLRFILKKSIYNKLSHDYLKTLNKDTSCNYRIEFLKQCPNNDIISVFLRLNFFRTTVHILQLKLLKQEINPAEKGRKVFLEKFETDRSNFREKVRPELMPSVVGSVRREMRDHSAMVQNRLNGKINKLSERQDRPVRNGSHTNVVTMDGPVRDKFNEVHFLGDVWKLVRELRENKMEGGKF